MATITRQALTDAIDPVDLLHGQKSEDLQRAFAWLFSAWMRRAGHMRGCRLRCP